MANALFFVGTARAEETSENLSIFDSVSPAASPISDLFVFVLLTIGIIFLFTEGTLIWSILKFRSKGDHKQEPPQIYGSNPIELAWTVIPIIIVFTLFLVTTRTIFSLDLQEPPAEALRVKVTGHQWWWEFEYPDLDITTANELHVQTGVPVFLELRSADVIHSFWVPRLAGKTDLIPNRENHMWFEAEEDGTWYGQCAEFCGTQHASMLLRVISEDEQSFQSWATNQSLQVKNQTQPVTGESLFMQLACINCHNIQGLTMRGGFGPDLTHLMTRGTIASGASANTPAQLKRWLKDPNNIKPGCNMPNMMLSDSQIDTLVEYLTTLR